MSIVENKAIVSHFAEVVVNGGHYERRNEFLTPILSTTAARRV